MIKIVLMLFLMTLSVQAQTEPIHAISFNLHCVLEDWKMRIDEIAKHMARARPDFIAFQEVCIDQFNDMPQGILEALARHGYPVASHHIQYGHMAWDKYDEYLMVISRHPIQREEKGFLPKSPLQRSYLAYKVNGIWLINVHLEYRDDWASYRAEQVRFLIDKFKGRPHIIMGDFNSEPTSFEQTLFHDRGYKSYFPGPSRPANNPTMAIDGFWVSPELQGRLSGSRSELLFKQSHGGIYLSDHLGVDFKAIRNPYQ